MERDLNAAINRQERQRREIERRNREQIDRLRRELQQTKRDMDASYAQKARSLAQELTARERRFQEELRRADEQAQARRAELLRTLQAANEELREEVAQIRRKEFERTQNGQALARERTRYAEERAAAVERMPHAYFCPGQLDLFREHLSSVQSMIRSGMYEAAAATADAAGAELEILEINVRQQRREWEEMYAAYRETVLRVRDKLSQFQREELFTPCGKFRMNDEERDYWSRENYSAIRTDARNACAMVDEIERDGDADAYLAELSASQGQHFSPLRFGQELKKLNRLEERADAVISCIRDERYFSDERYQLAGEIETRLSAEGYRVTLSRFRGEPEEPLDCYDLELRPNERDILRLTFIPVRRDGVTAQTLCLVTADVASVPNPALIEHWARDVMNGIRREFPKLNIVWREEPGRRDEVEREYKKEPDMRLLAKKLEKKYQ